MLGLVIAFSFSGVAARFNEKRMLIADEVEAIETAYLRLQLVPQSERVALQELFRRYVDSRLETYRRLPDMQAASAKMAESKSLQEEIWTMAVTATQLPQTHSDAGEVLLRALNNMINITTTRTMMLQAHPRRIIYVLLFSLGLICSVLAGYRMASGHRRSWVHILSYTVVTMIVVYVVLDMEYPREGVIRLDAADQMLVKIRDRMN